MSKTTTRNNIYFQSFCLETLKKGKTVWLNRNGTSIIRKLFCKQRKWKFHFHKNVQKLTLSTRNNVFWEKVLGRPKLMSVQKLSVTLQLNLWRKKNNSNFANVNLDSRSNFSTQLYWKHPQIFFNSRKFSANFQ